MKFARLLPFMMVTACAPAGVVDVADDVTPEHSIVSGILLVDPSNAIYEQDEFPRFDLEIPPASWAALTSSPTTYARATLHYGAEVVSDIGLRLKGSSNFVPLGQKASFKIKFDHFVAGQRFHNLKNMTLNAGLEDPSLLAERLSYAAFRAAGLPAPRANNATVTVNGANYGVYVNVETEDKTFLKRWFANNDGNLYEQQDDIQWVPGNEDGLDLETNEAENNRSDLAALFEATQSASDATLLADVASILDVNQFLRYCAWEGLVNQWDGLAYSPWGPNNHRLYDDPSTGRFSILPWGMDMAMKEADEGQYIDIWAAKGLFLQRCVNVATCKAQYAAVLAAEADKFATFDLPTLADQWYNQIRDARYADPLVPDDVETFEDTVAEVRQFLVDRPGLVHGQL